MGKSHPADATTVHVLKVTLKGSKPPIWRKVALSSESTLGDLHDVIQSLMSWDNSHLHCFRIGTKEYGDLSMLDSDGEALEEHDFTLGRVARNKGAKFVYEYDFGDSWEHVIEVFAIQSRDESLHYPVCLGGARAGPLEDCGGIWGWQWLCEARAKKPEDRSTDEKERLEGVCDFDPEKFDIDGVNRRLGSDRR